MLPAIGKEPHHVLLNGCWERNGFFPRQKLGETQRIAFMLSNLCRVDMGIRGAAIVQIEKCFCLEGDDMGLTENR